ncbi:hypothetical protein Tsubulata_008216 [Turnera subulata]|uniref:Pentacotripeptide-repeat region of PRORP domain-containing protein n=1 Tax=Turnera subulata TaxID=218843 RepID=A0A9Q0GB85_9ROSI|nr:hypothetical protein Tsubulata_008216 [Turnera subulata]
MASSRLSISLDTLYPRESNFSKNPIQPPRYCALSSSSHFTGASIITSLGRLCPVKFSRIDTELSQDHNLYSTSPSSRDESRTENNSVERNPGFRPVIQKIWRNPKRLSKREVGSTFSYKRNDSQQKRQDFYVYGDGGLDVNYSVLEPSLSLEQCNAILKRLERFSSDERTLRFFEWMKGNEKLEKNIDAYNFVLRVLSRRRDWESAERMIRELSTSMVGELDCRVFNTLIYPCSKWGLVQLAAKWFRMMLEIGVKPNVATYGMLMGLYQKGWNVEEAEFAFAHMRSLGIICESAYSAMITIYTRLNLYEKAEKVIGFLSEDKVVLDLNNWLVLLNANCQRGKLEEAEKVLALMQEAGFRPNIVAYNMLITGYGKISNMDAAQRLFLSIQNNGLKPDETTYRSMIEGWGRAGNYKEVDWYYKELKRMGFEPNSSNLYTLINLQAEHGDEEGASRTLDDMLKTGCQYSSIFGTLLKAYERAGRFQTIPCLIKGCFHQHVMVNQTSCSSLAIAYVKHSLVDDALELLRKKVWKDLGFEENLYHLLICSCKEMNNLDDAIKIYNQMPKSSEKPNLHIACTMIDIYSNMGLFAEGEKVYLNLKSAGIALDMIAFSIVVRMYVKAGSVQDACSVLETMERQKDIVPDIYLLRDMLRIYQQCGMTEKLKDLYYKILRSRVVWDQEMYNCIINCCARALPVDELSKVFNEMLQHSFVPNTITYNVMLDVYGKAKHFSKAKELFYMARKQGLIDVISYNTIVDAYGKNGDFERMVSTVKEMQFDGFAVSLEAYNSMLDAYAKGGNIESFRNILHRMRNSRCTSDHYTYNIMINIYGEKGWIDEVADVLTELRENGLQPDLCSYNTLIKAYGIAGMVEEAVGLVKEMRTNGIEPDKITYVNMIAALQRNDKHLEAVKWSLWMKQLGL